MQFRTFRAASLQDALEDIRRQMGDEASVLQTRQVREGWMGWLGKTSVEVTAGIREADDPPRPTAQEPAGTESSHRRGYPLELRNLREWLALAGVDDPIADAWIESTHSLGCSQVGDQDPGQSIESGQSIGSGQAIESGQWLELLRQTVARGIQVAGPIEVPAGQRRVVALVGPTGVGKTTTIAKLAAGFRLQARRKVALVTIDTFRIAAVQQLQAYAEIMDLAMETVQSAEEMTAALERLRDADLVLVDTAGRSPRSEGHIGQLSAMLRIANPDATHLVLSATSSRDAIQNIIDGFSPVKPTAAILTKLDETTQLAGPLSALSGQTIPISYLTTGQQVPDDIETATTARLTQNLLGPHAPDDVMFDRWSTRNVA